MKKIALATIAIFASLPSIASAQAIKDATNKLGGVADKAGLGATTSPAQLVSRIINISIGFLGVVAVILILYAGGMWLTAAGDSGKVEQAKKIIRTTVIGVIVVGLAYAITTFILNLVVARVLV